MLGERRAGPIPVDAYRRGNEFTVHLDLPGVDPRFIAVTVEKDLLAVRATRACVPAEEDRIQMTERPQGDFSRQLFVDERLDGDRITTVYDNGVRTLTIPVAEEAKPRKVEIVHAGDQLHEVMAASVAECATGCGDVTRRLLRESRLAMSRTTPGLDETRSTSETSQRLPGHGHEGVPFGSGTLPRVRSRMTRTWVGRSVSGLVSVSLALGVLAACAGGGDAGSPDEARVAAIYGAVILAFADGHSADQALPVVFVAPRQDAKPIPLGVQAAVVDELASDVSVRFVDDDSEATDSAVDGRPVKEGVLLRLGPVAAGDPIEVTADRYRALTDQQLVTLSARSNGGSWSARVIAEAPLPPQG